MKDDTFFTLSSQNWKQSAPLIITALNYVRNKQLEAKYKHQLKLDALISVQVGAGGRVKAVWATHPVRDACLAACHTSFRSAD